MAATQRLSGVYRSVARACTVLPISATCCPTARPGRGSPMTSSWPASSRSRWCAGISGSLPGRGSSGEGLPARQGDPGIAL